MGSEGLVFIMVALVGLALFLVMLPADFFGYGGDFTGFNSVYIPLIPLLIAIGAGFYSLSRRR